MSPDLPTAVGVGGAALAAVKFLHRLVGPAADELGATLQDGVREFRMRRQLRLLRRSEEMLAAAGLDAGSVSLKTVFPLLEGASLEDDDSMSERWAALLANAAAGRRYHQVPPLFAHILTQMQPGDAELLDYIFDISGYSDFPDQRREPPEQLRRHDKEPWKKGFEMHALLDGFEGGNNYHSHVSISALAALGLLERDQPLDAEDGGRFFPSANNYFRMSQLGYAFVRACRPPRRGDD